MPTSKSLDGRTDGAPSAPPAAQATAQPYSTRQVQYVVAGLMLAMLLASLDQTIVSTALTTISRDFGRPDLYSWVVTAYLLASTASTPLYGKISDLYGRKKVFQFAIVIFLVGSALCGLSQNMIELILFRGVAGLGAGGLMSLAMAIVGDVVPPRQRGRYQGYFGGVFGASSVLGPLIGGFLVDQASWRWVFYVNLPIGVVALVVVQVVLRADQIKRSAKIDYLGALLMVVGISLVLIAVQDIGTGASSSAWVLGAAGLVLVALFLWWETRASEPILPLRLFRGSVFAVSNALSLITGAVMFGAIIFLPQYLQIVKHLSPTVSGLHLLPMLVGLLLTSIVSGLLVTKYGRYRVFVVSGTAVLVVGLVLLTRVGVSTGFWAMSGTLFVVGVGIGLFSQILVVAAQNAVGQKDLGVATSTVSFCRTLGGALGASVLGVVLISHEATVLPAQIASHGRVQGPLYAFAAGMDRAYLWAVPVAVLGFALAFLLRDLPMRSTLDSAAPSVPTPTVPTPTAPTPTAQTPTAQIPTATTSATPTPAAPTAPAVMATADGPAAYCVATPHVLPLLAPPPPHLLETTGAPSGTSGR